MHFIIGVARNNDMINEVQGAVNSGISTVK